MARWRGRGIPPTRRKLHAWRMKNAKEQDAFRSARRTNASRWDRAWRRAKGGLSDEEVARFVDRWGR